LLKLMYITNDKNIAKIAQDSGVDRIFIDLEQIGKEERQKNLDTVKSHHTIEDVQNIRSVLDQAELFVRINPINSHSSDEIDRVVDSGADVIMLPYFKTVKEVEIFLTAVNGRAKTCLLVETPQAVNNIDEILELGGFDEIHIGLNDLHLGMHMKFMFELLTDNTVDTLCKKFRERDLFYGFGGIAQLGKGIIPAEKIIAEHYRLGSEMAILSRSFCNSEYITDYEQLKSIFNQGIADIRNYENSLINCEKAFLIDNHREICSLVEAIVKGEQ